MRKQILVPAGLLAVAAMASFAMFVPATAAWAIGLLVGINLVFGGTALIAMALHAGNPASRGI